MKMLVQCYKSPAGWQTGTPGIGDYLKGAISLMELGERHGLRVKLDISAHSISRLIHFNEELFHRGQENEINSAPEFFVTRKVPIHGGIFARRKSYTKLDPPLEIHQEIRDFAHSSKSAYFVACNLGNSLRPAIPHRIGKKMRPFFASTIHLDTPAEYEVVSLRCSDSKIGDGRHDWSDILRCIKFEVLPHIKKEVVVTSCNRDLRGIVADAFGFRVLQDNCLSGPVCQTEDPRAVVADMMVLKDAKKIYSISEYPWPTGFASQVCLIFNVPGVHFYLKGGQFHRFQIGR